MYAVISFIEKAFRYIIINLRIFYWKIKFGKRIKIGKNFRFRKSLIINISKNGYVEIGNNCFFNNYCSINCHEKIIIGDDNIFGESVRIYDHNHVFNKKRINKRKTYNSRPIVIGYNNWIGSNVIILSKTNIGSNNVIAANTTVNDEYKSDCIITNGNKPITKKIKYEAY